jgi:ribonuclease HI
MHPAPRDAAPELHATLTIDGSVSHTTGLGGSAAVLKFYDGSHKSASAAIHTTRSSDAEYTALHLGLDLALESGVTHLVVYGDSQSVTDAVNGDARFPKQHGELATLVARFTDVYAVHVPRAENAQADLLARIARPRHTDGRHKRPKGEGYVPRSSQFHRNRRKRRSDPNKRFV